MGTACALICEYNDPVNLSPDVWFLLLSPPLFLILPITSFLVWGWSTRKEEIISKFSTDDAIKKYFQQFAPERLDTKSQDLKTTFRDHCMKHFGRRTFPLPGATLLCGVAIATLTVTGVGVFRLPFDRWADISVLPVSFYAVLGAYLWILYDFISESLRRALSPSNFFWAAFRLVVAVPLAGALTAPLKEDFAAAVAFLLGAFPIQTLLVFARTFVVKQLSISEGPEGQVSELQFLQSLDRSAAERLSEQNVRTILQLAWADPVILTVRTNLGFSTVVDFVSQALLWLYVGKDLEKLRKYGIRGAQEVASLWDSLVKPADPEEQNRAKQTIAAVAKELGVDEGPFQSTLDQVANDPYSRFLYSIWD